MEKRRHVWTYDEGYYDADGNYSGDSELFCDLCHAWRTLKRAADGKEIPYDYVEDDDEPDCPGR